MDGRGGFDRRRLLGALGMGAAGWMVARGAQAATPTGGGSAGGSPPPAGPPAAAAPAVGYAAKAAGTGLHAGYPRLDPAEVEAVVGLSHRDLEGVRRLVERRPELSRAQWDWGFGDFETALGAASHTGQREIALLLLRHGARPDIFSAAMLGQLEVVRAFVAASPGIQATPGPHGISLLGHARAGGAPAAAVVAYLEELGGAAGVEYQALAEGEAARYFGTYAVVDPAGETFEVSATMGLALARVGGGSPRRLQKVGEHRFQPAGAPSIEVRFELGAGGAAALTVSDPDRPLRAVRTAVPPGAAGAG